MDFALLEHQEMLRKTAADWLQSRCPVEFVRAMEKDDKGYLPELWQEMAANGWLEIVFPEEYGGRGMGFVDLAVLLEEMGRVCFPGPYFSTVVLAGLTILEAGTKEQKQRFLPSIIQGNLLASVAIVEPSGGWDAESIELVASSEKNHFVLNGTKLFVPYAHIADWIIVAARTAAGISLFMVDTKMPGTTVSILKTIARDKQCEVVLENVKVPAANLLGELDKGWNYLENVLRKAAVAKCAEMVGGAQQVLEMTVNYAKERIQFGRPVGSFQAIQHHCANMAADVDSSRYITYRAAWKLDEGLDERREAAMAKAWVSNAFRRVTSLGHEVHGGAGFIEEHPMQIHFRRAKAAELMFGDAEYHREIVAQEIGL